LSQTADFQRIRLSYLTYRNKHSFTHAATGHRRALLPLAHKREYLENYGYIFTIIFLLTLFSKRGLCMRFFNRLGRTVALAAVVVGCWVAGAGAQTWNVGVGEDSASVTATLSEGTLTVSGTGRMKNSGNTPWYSSRFSITNVVIDDGVTSVGDYAFDGCTGLTSITIPNSVDSIRYNAFSNCTGLTSITIPYGVTSIMTGAFSGCTGLKSVTIPNSVKYLSGFSGCSGLISIIIPTGVTSIGDNAFDGCTGLMSITIPNSVNTIETNAFRNCTGLTSLTIPNSVTYIESTNERKCTTSGGVPLCWTSDYRAFVGCTGLKSVTIGSGLTSASLGAFNFASYPNLATIAINVKSIKSDAFRACSSLTSVTLGNNVDTVGQSAFSGCTALTSLSVSSGVIGDSAFSRCTGLTSISFGKGIKKIGTRAFDGCTALTSVAIDSDTIGNYAFNKLTNMTTLILGENVKSIYGNAFNGCSRITSLTIPSSVKSIGAGAFSGCTRLASAIIGSGVTSIGADAFNSCAGLSKLVSLSSDPPVVAAASAFTGIDKVSCKLFVSSADIGPYRAAAHWKDFTIEAAQFAAVPVTDITGVPESFKAGKTLALTATVSPANATNRTLVWSVASAGATGATLAGSTLNAASPGTVVVRAAIADGALVGANFERYFFITAESDAVSVAANERVIPQINSSQETAAVAPVSKLASGLTAGPVPAGVSGATPVRFFRQGSRVEGGSLYVYDVSGNVVRRIAVSDNAVGSGSKRVVGSWDLTDAKGHPVGEGTYLVKGSVKSKGGKSEKVSVVVGIAR
jgi:hypothetical protein